MCVCEQNVAMQFGKNSKNKFTVINFYSMDRASKAPVLDVDLNQMSELADYRYGRAEIEFIRCVFFCVECVFLLRGCCRSEIMNPLKVLTRANPVIAARCGIQILHRQQRPDEDSFFCFARGVLSRRLALSAKGVKTIMNARSIDDLNCLVNVCSFQTLFN